MIIQSYMVFPLFQHVNLTFDPQNKEKYPLNGDLEKPELEMDWWPDGHRQISSYFLCDLWIYTLDQVLRL